MRLPGFDDRIYDAKVAGLSPLVINSGVVRAIVLMTDQELLEAWRKQIDFDNLTWHDQTPTFFDRRQQRREQAARERAVKDRQYFGEETWGASQQHLFAKTNEDRLKKNGLPLIHSELELAKWLGISLKRLRYFTHDNPVDTVWHYVKYTIPKRSGGQRVILAPKTELKRLQRKILREMLDKLHPHKSAHGFIIGRSIVSNAQRHVNKVVVLRIDLKDFFPTITYPRIRGLFILWGYSFSVASTLALLCTEHDRTCFEHDDQTYWISLGARTLVQGAPTSPALANLAVWGMDRALSQLAARRSFVYTRYADDLTFSGDRLDTLLFIEEQAKQIVAHEGFVVNDSKTHKMRRSTRQTVTGLIVNDKVSVSRAMRRELRAVLHNAVRTGLAAQNRENRPNFRSYLQGMIGFISQSNPDEGARLLEQLHSLS
jgi:RNA-directed DNA polymerase